MFYKILDSNLRHNGVQYQLGLNVETNDKQNTVLDVHKLGYTDLENICTCLFAGSLIAEVEPKGDVKRVMGSNIYTTDRLYVHNISKISDWYETQTEEVKQILEKQYGNRLGLNGHAIQFFKEPSTEMKIDAINENPNTIRWMENPSETLKQLAVSKSGNVIGHIKNPSRELQIIAVSSNGGNIRYIENPSEEVKLIAINNNANSIQFIENPSELLQVEAIKKEVGSILFIKNPSEKAQLTAIEKNHSSFRCINNPTESAKQAYSIAESARFLKITQDSSVLKYSV